MTCSSGFVAAAAPIGLAGDAAKIAALRLFGSLSITEATRCALFDRVVGVQWLCLIGLATLPFQGAAGLSAEIILPQLAIFSAPIVGVGVLLALPSILARIPGHLIERIARVFAGYRSILLPSRSAIQGAIMLLNVVLAGGRTLLVVSGGGFERQRLAHCRVHSAAAARERPSVPLHGLGRARDCHGEHAGRGGQPDNE